MYGEFPITKMVIELEQDNLLPAILFRTSRKQCDVDVEKALSSRACIVDGKKTDSIKKEIDAVITKYSLERSTIEDHPHYESLLKTRIGAHHAGQLLHWRLLLEELMTRGVLKVMVATGTVAAGVDFPARTVVITAHSKRGDEGFRVLTASELQQMSGRAGRRGKDTVGICLFAPGRFCDARILHKVIDKPPEPLRSAYFASPSTVLNLLKFRNVDDLKFTVEQSLAAFLDRKSANAIRTDASTIKAELERDNGLPVHETKRREKRVRRKFREADVLEKRQEKLLSQTLSGLEALGHIEGGKLTEKGTWAASLCTNLVLELAEAIHSGLFYDLQVEELVGLVAAIAGDPHRPYFRIKENPFKEEYFKELEKIVERVDKNYQRTTLQHVAVLRDAALTVNTWIEARDWSEFSSLLNLAGVAPGDVARLVNQTSEHLNQITRLYDTHTELARTAAEGRRLLLRPPFNETLIAEEGE